MSKAEIQSTELQIEGEPSVEQALFIWMDSAAEFADCLIGMRHLEVGCQATASFDQRALKLPGFIAALGAPVSSQGTESFSRRPT